MKPLKNDNSRGFTLIELIMVIVLVALLGVTLSGIFNKGADSYSFIIGRKEALQDARQALFQIARDIRQIKDINNILSASESSLQFKIPVYQGADQTITYSYASNALTRNDNLLADGVSSLQFGYYDLHGNQLSGLFSPLNIWRIQVTLSVQKGKENVTLVTQAFPRNLKFGVVQQ